MGQLDSSPSLPDGDRDISGPASPVPEPGLEDGSGGSCGGFWLGSALRPLGIGLEELRGGVEFREPGRNPSDPGGRGKGQRTRSSHPKVQGSCLLREDIFQISFPPSQVNPLFEIHLLGQSTAWLDPSAAQITEAG